MNPSTRAERLKPLLTPAAFAEFVAAGGKAQKSLLLKPVETLIQNSFNIRVRRCKAVSLAVLPVVRVCVACDEPYNGSTAPIEPTKFCSRQCEIDKYGIVRKNIA